MQVELDEEVLKKQLELAITVVAEKVIKDILNSWRFEDRVKGIIGPIIDDTIRQVAKSQIADLDKLREVAKTMLLRKLNSQLHKAMNA